MEFCKETFVWSKRNLTENKNFQEINTELRKFCRQQQLENVCFSFAWYRMLYWPFSSTASEIPPRNRCLNSKTLLNSVEFQWASWKRSLSFPVVWHEHSRNFWSQKNGKVSWITFRNETFLQRSRRQSTTAASIAGRWVRVQMPACARLNEVSSGGLWFFLTAWGFKWN